MIEGSNLRQQKLLRQLLETSGWVTGADISVALGVSDRTVRSDVSALNVILRSYTADTAEIVSRRGRGYRLNAAERPILEKALGERLSEGDNKGDSSRDERVRRILLMLLMARQPLRLDDLEDAFYISRSTLEIDLKSIKTMLATFYPALQLRRGGGKINLPGSEFAARGLLRKMLLMDYDARKRRLNGGRDEFYSRDAFYRNLAVVTGAIEDGGLYMNDENAADIAAYLTIADRRIREGRYITVVDCAQGHLERAVTELAETLYTAALPGREQDMPYRGLEVHQLAAQLSFINLFKPKVITKEQLIRDSAPQVINIVDALLTNIEDDFNLDLRGDEDLFVSLTLHLKVLINRVRHRQVEVSPILKIMKRDYPFIFELSLHLYELFKSYLDLRLTESEISYVAAHIAAAIERKGYSCERAPIRVALISHLGAGYSNLLVSKLRTEYGDSLEVLGPYPLFRWAEAAESRPALLLTTSELTGQPADIPALQIEAGFPDASRRALDVRLRAIRKERVDAPYAYDDVIGIFRPELFFAGRETPNYQEGVSFLCGAMGRLGLVPPEFEALTLEREEVTSTLLANGIMIPHPIRACAYKTAIAALIPREPIPWGDQEARLIFLIAVRPGEKRCLKGFFDLVSGLMDDGAAALGLTKLTRYEDFISYIQNTRKRRNST
ncbi:MAG: BglG family transcription antiterminator [Peptococcaceae bacterium]|jgi:transcriptional antiterminator/mannitol/fructose-specific phosphotransferase system IIA component (Ntr-type)|nr:BglG family transcription antiterminator [Peptococcaceae bacterium]